MDVDFKGKNYVWMDGLVLIVKFKYSMDQQIVKFMKVCIYL